MKRYLSAFVCGFGAGVLQIVPVAKYFTCCIIIPVAAMLALYLEQQATKDFSKIVPSRAIMIGIITGLWAALFGSVFEIFITFVTKNNDIVATFSELQKMISDFPISAATKDQFMSLMNYVKDQIVSTGFSPLYSISVVINNLVVNTIFGLVGGLIGAQILNSRNSAS